MPLKDQLAIDARCKFIKKLEACSGGVSIFEYLIQNLSLKYSSPLLSTQYGTLTQRSRFCANSIVALFNVWGHIAFLRKHIITLSAFIWPFSSVCSQVCHQMDSLGGCMVTLVTFEWFLTVVNYQMSFQTSLIRRLVLTLVAHERFFTCVFSHVSHQFSFFTWCILTLVAFVRLFSAVHFHMSPQVKWFDWFMWTLKALKQFFSTVDLCVCIQSSYNNGCKIA